MIKMLTFRKGETLDLTHDMGGQLMVKVGEHIFTMGCFKLQYGHDDSLPYHGVLYMDGIKLCTCLNDGWGGMTEMHGVDNHAEETMKIVKEKLKDYNWSYYKDIIPLTLDFIADTLASTLSMTAKR